MIKALTPMLFIAALVSCPDVLASTTPVYLDQGWTEENNLRAQSYHASEGSQLIPYEWFLHLKTFDSTRLLRSDKVIEGLGYLPDYDPDPHLNPDRLPIGFAKDSDPSTGDWIGLNCSACHTGQLRYGGKVIRVDGAPSMGDYVGLLITVRNSVDKTLHDKRRFQGFAAKLSSVKTPADHTKLRQQMRDTVKELDIIIRNSWSPDHAPGFGRIDAFAAIRNKIFVTDLGIAANYQLPSAPVSYPFLWDTPELDRVQWVGHVDNPYGRNAGQVASVMGRINLQDPDKLFESSIRRDTLFLLEKWIAELRSPKWPAEILGEIDLASAARGRQLYATPDALGYSCVQCHTLPGDDGKYPLTPASDNRFGLGFIKTFNIPVADVGTDPNTILNIYDPKPLDTGVIASIPGGEPRMVAASLLNLITKGTVAKLFAQPPALTPEQQTAYIRFRVKAADNASPPRNIGYKARPLNGIWATAPYLHNGSVPNLYNLLLPEKKRAQVFWVGNFTFDDERVGYVSRYSRGAFKYDTRRSGNRNTGHLYGTTFSEADRWDLIEFLKTL